METDKVSADSSPGRSQGRCRILADQGGVVGIGARLAVIRETVRAMLEVGLLWRNLLPSTYTLEGCCDVRVTGTDLEKRPGIRIDRNTGKMIG